MYKLYQYSNTQFRVVISKSDFVPSHSDKKTSSNSELSSLSRSKRMIREYSLCNNFTYFFTCTVNSALCDRFSLSETQKKMRQIMKSIKRKRSDFIYLFITEKHKNGAFHFHGLCSDVDFYTNSNGYLSSPDFDKLGFNSFSKIRSTTKVSNYITKYITKDCVKNEAGSVYFCSRGLRRADSYEIAPADFTGSFSVIPFENDFLKIYDFNLHDLSTSDLLFFSSLQEKKKFLLTL